MNKYIAASIIAALSTNATAQTSDGLSDNGIVTIGGDRGLQFESKDGEFSFKPYLLMQTSLNVNYYDDEGLDKAYNQDNVANSGFSIPYACLGFTGKAWSKVTYNLTINASASSAKLLQQAWFDVNVSHGLGVKVGKFKTPFSHAYLTTLGESLMPMLPTSLTATSIMEHRLNAVTPTIDTGFDLGVEFHGMMGKWWSYEAGLFNGTGAGTNSATKTISDDWHIPSLLYAGRIAWMPNGVMPKTQGNPKLLNENKFMLAGAANLNVEAQSESTNDQRYGIEAAWLHNRLYLGGEFYWMHVSFTERMKEDVSYDYKGGYVQAGYFVSPQVQVTARYDFLDRNGSDKDGFLNMPAVGCNYFIKDTGLKLSAMYQFTGRTGHANQIDRDNDDLGIAKHCGMIMLQYAF